MARPPPERPAHDIWPEWYGREMPPPLDPRGEIDSMSTVAGQTRVRRGGRPDEDAIRRHDRLRRVYAAYLRECIGGREMLPGWRGEAGIHHWMAFRDGYLAGQAGAGEDVALEDHEAWTERIRPCLPNAASASSTRRKGRFSCCRDHVPDGRRGATPGPEVSEGNKGVAAWLEGELAHVAPFLNSELGPCFPELVRGTARPGTRNRTRTAGTAERGQGHLPMKRSTRASILAGLGPGKRRRRSPIPPSPHSGPLNSLPPGITSRRCRTSGRGSSGRKIC